MKRIWLAAGLAAGMVMLCCLLLYSTGQVTRQLNDTLEQLAAAEENDPAAGEEISALIARWEKWETRLSLHIRHDELEEVTRALTRVESHWEAGEYRLYRVACAEATVAVEHLLEEAKLTLRNVL